MALTLYGAPLSPFVRKVRVLLAEKGVAYTLDPVFPFAPPEGYRKLHPLGKVPALRDGDQTLADSSVICTYLERRFPSPALYAKGDYEHARGLWFEEYADTGLFQSVGPGVFMPLVVAPLIGQARDAELAKKTVAESLPPLYDYLEGELGDHEYLVDDSFGIADIAIGTQFVNLQHCDVRPEARRWPRLAAFVERILGRPTFKQCIAEEKKILEQLASR